MIRLISILAWVTCVLAVQDARAQDITLIAGARVFDGTGAPARVQDVLIDGDRIVAVGNRLDLPKGGAHVDGEGKTLIPGLHDLHTHLRSPAYDTPEDLGKAFAGYLLAGVTTVNDYSVSGEMIAPVRDLVRAPNGLWAPHLRHAVRMGVPGGHGTEYGWGSFFTMQATTARAAHVRMPLALAYDPDVIKVFVDGWRYGRDGDTNSMNEPTLSAMVTDAHKAGKPVVTHTVTLEGAKMAAAADVDALVHGIGDAPVDSELIDLMRRSETAYVATLVVFEPQQTREFTSGEWAQLNPGERARESMVRARKQSPIRPYDARRWKIMRQNIARLKKAGIPIGIGSDAGIDGVYHGPAAVREIRWLTKLGFTPAEALVAATRTSAEIMHQADDRGTIAPGMRADLVLIDGRPDKRIEDLWKVSRVWVSGRAVPLDILRELADSPRFTPMPIVKMTGPILTSGRSDGRTDLETLPFISTDRGTDHSTMIALDAARDGMTLLAAQMGDSSRPYAQWNLPLTRGPINVADASAFVGIELRAKGHGNYRLVLESYAIDDGDWFAATFEPAADGKPLRIPFSEFGSRDSEARLDLTQLRALRFELSGETGGTVSLELGDVRFYRP
ncbi:MAG: amidohydrolase family protein [Allopontixanthobacter sediminis]